MKAALVASKDIARQLRDLVGETGIDIAEHLPTYSPSQFASIPSPGTVSRPPFRVFFAGRIEANKGIYDIVEIARRLNAERPGMFQFDICGDGGELDALRRLVEGFEPSDRRHLSRIPGLAATIRCVRIVACGYRPNDFPVRGRI